MEACRETDTLSRKHLPKFILRGYRGALDFIMFVYFGFTDISDVIKV